MQRSAQKKQKARSGLKAASDNEAFFLQQTPVPFLAHKRTLSSRLSIHSTISFYFKAL